VLKQMYKVFAATCTALKVTGVKHERNLCKAQRDTLKTLNTLSAELKWPTNAIRGIVIPTTTLEVSAVA
jgi:hypothetical protein